jgi:hypothetical protein
VHSREVVILGEIDTSRRRNMFNRESSVSYIYLRERPPRRFHLCVYEHSALRTLCMYVFPNQRGGVCVRRHDCCGLLLIASRDCLNAVRRVQCNANQLSMQNATFTNRRCVLQLPTDCTIIFFIHFIPPRCI